VTSLLDGAKFTSSRGKPWREGVESPTTDEFSVVPVGFQGHFVPVNNESCMRCHRDAGKVVNLTGDERWRLRGGDTIFSFHPFNSGEGKLELNPELASAGFVAKR
jgi:hypothetical protein